tara:strand:- start:597 stop:923 length:327 start_codon:yes stop_codon:yes gene_type:complete
MLRRKKKNKKNKKRQKESNSNSLLGLMGVVMLLIALLNQLIQSDRIETLIGDQNKTLDKIQRKDDEITSYEREFDIMFEDHKEIIASALYGEGNWFKAIPKTSDWKGK